MRKLVLAFCLLASVCTYHLKVQNVQIEYLKIGKLNIPPSKFKLDTNALASNKELVNTLLEISKKEPYAGTEAILNDYADKIFANIGPALVEGGVDPLALPDVHEGFNYTLIITYWGSFDMYDGSLADISTIKRGGDVIVSYSTEDKFLEITLPIAFDDMNIYYDYDALLMGLGPRGYVTGIISNLAIEVKLGFHTDTLTFTFDEFYITHAGDIDVSFHGDDLIDWLLNLFLDIVNTALKEVVLLVVEDIVRGGLESIVDSINQAIGAFLNPTTPVPDTTPALLFYR